MLQSFVSHHRPEIGASDADVHYVADAFAGVAQPLPATNTVTKRGHLIEDGMNFGHDVFAIERDGCIIRSTQGSVQHGAVLGNIYLLPAKHRLNSFAQVALRCELQE